MAKIGQYTMDKNKAVPEWEAWKAKPDDETFNALFKKVEPVVNSAMRSFAGDDPRLKTRAKIITAQAFDNYDPSKGAALNTHVYNQLQRLHRYRAERSSAIHIPENTRLDAGNISRYVQEYQDEHGIEPSDNHLADALEISMGRIKRARAIGEASSSQMQSEKGDIPGKPRDFSAIWSDYVYHDLPEKDKKIYEWVTGYNGHKRLPKSEIARRMGISQAAVSQRVGRIANKLQEGLK